MGLTLVLWQYLRHIKTYRWVKIKNLPESCSLPSLFLSKLLKVSFSFFSCSFRYLLNSLKSSPSFLSWSPDEIIFCRDVQSVSNTVDLFCAFLLLPAPQSAVAGVCQLGAEYCKDILVYFISALFLCTVLLLPCLIWLSVSSFKDIFSRNDLLPYYWD